jgi:hypothetical protein
VAFNAKYFKSLLVTKSRRYVTIPSSSFYFKKNVCNIFLNFERRTWLHPHSTFHIHCPRSTFLQKVFDSIFFGMSTFSRKIKINKKIFVGRKSLSC